MKHHIIVIILGLVALDASGADNPWYVGAGGGLAEIHGGYVQVNPANSVIQQSRSTHNPVATWNLAAGYRLSPYLAVEADYEQPSAVNSLTVLDSLSVRDHTFHQDLGLSLVGSYPLNARLRLYGGAGLGHSWERDDITAQFPASNPTIIPIPGTTQQFWRAQLRAGAELGVTHALSLRLGWDRPDANLRNWSGYNSIQKLSIDNFGATALWAF